MIEYHFDSWPGSPSPLQGDNQPDIKPLSDKKYRLVEPYEVGLVDDIGITYKLTVPKGFVSDGASVPRLVWTISGLRPDGLIRAAALVHDFLYRNKGQVVLVKSNAPKFVCLSRRNADRIFLEVMKESGMSGYRAAIAHRFVRLFGWRHW